MHHPDKKVDSIWGKYGTREREQVSLVLSPLANRTTTIWYYSLVKNNVAYGFVTSLIFFLFSGACIVFLKVNLLAFVVLDSVLLNSEIVKLKNELNQLLVDKVECAYVSTFDTSLLACINLPCLSFLLTMTAVEVKIWGALTWTSSCLWRNEQIARKAGHPCWRKRKPSC